MDAKKSQILALCKLFEFKFKTNINLTFIRSRSRQPIYDPESLSEAEYFVTPKEIGSSRESGLENSHSIEIEWVCQNFKLK